MVFHAFNSELTTIFFQLSIQSQGLDFEGTDYITSPAPSILSQEHPAVAAFLNWNPTSQITQCVDDLNYVPEPPRLSLDVRDEKGDIEERGNRRALEEWYTGVQANHDNNLDENQPEEMSALHEVSTQAL